MWPSRKLGEPVGRTLDRSASGRDWDPKDLARLQRALEGVRVLDDVDHRSGVALGSCDAPGDGPERVAGPDLVLPKFRSRMLGPSMGGRTGPQTCHQDDRSQ